MPLLKEAITYCKLTNLTILDIAAKCKSLLELLVRNMSEITDSSIKELSFGCSKLKYLDLSFNKHNGDEGGLNVAQLGLKENCYITDTKMLSISEHCDNLQSSDLYCCSHFRDKGIYKVLQRCVELKKLNIKKCKEIRTYFTLKHINSVRNKAGHRTIFPSLTPNGIIPTNKFLV